MGYVDIDPDSTSGTDLFALPALFITLRETVEAAIIVSVLLGLLDRLQRPELKRYVWVGVLTAMALCILAAVAVLIIFNVLKETFSTEAQLLTEAIMSMIAALLIAIVAVTIGNISGIYEKYHDRMLSEIEGEPITKQTILFLAFTSIAREGFETIIFFIGIGGAYPIKSLPIPAITGAILGILIGVLLYKFGGRLTISVFFKITMIVLVFIGAGIFVIGIHGLQEYGSFGTWEPPEDRPPLNRVLWDISSCCGLDKSEFWIFMRVLFGYTPNPTGLEILFYLLYHIFVWGAIIYKRWSAKRKDEGKPSLKQVLRAKLGKLMTNDRAKIDQQEEGKPLEVSSTQNDPHITLV